jgi:hypothetical protein
VLVMATAPVAVAAPEERATVLSIGNGDTIRVQKGQQRITVRLACHREASPLRKPDGPGSSGAADLRLDQAEESPAAPARRRGHLPSLRHAKDP